MGRCFKSAPLLGVAMLMASGCRTVSAQTEVPAVIANPSPQSKATLAKAVSEALHGAPVRVADDALTKTDQLIIEREHPLDPAGHPLDGRSREMPEHFRLVKSGDHCILIHQPSEQRFPLTGVSCSRFSKGL